MCTKEQPRDKVNKKFSKKKKEYGLFSSSLISRKITIPYKILGGNIKEILQKKLENQLEGKCNIEGFIKSSSINILTYSSGVLQEMILRYFNYMNKDKKRWFLSIAEALYTDIEKKHF